MPSLSGFNADSLSLAIVDILASITLLWDCPLHHRMDDSIAGLHLLEASGSPHQLPPPQVWYQTLLQTLPSVPCGQSHPLLITTILKRPWHAACAGRLVFAGPGSSSLRGTNLTSNVGLSL